VSGHARLNWRGPQAENEAICVLSDALIEIGLRIEGEARKELYPGHGKLTGTLQRSIHAASPDYTFSKDNVLAGKRTPERSNPGAVVPERRGNRLLIAVGTGMEYALIIHLLYRYIMKALGRVRPQALDIVRKHAARKSA